MEAVVEPKAPQKIGLAGVILGMLALCIAVSHFFFDPLTPPPPVGDAVASLASEIKHSFEAKHGIHFRVQPNNSPATSEKQPSFALDKAIDSAVIIAGLAAVCLGVFSFIKGQPKRTSASAVFLGGGAIAFQFAVVFTGVLITVMLIGYIMDALGLDMTS